MPSFFEHPLHLTSAAVNQGHFAVEQPRLSLSERSEESLVFEGWSARFVDAPRPRHQRRPSVSSNPRDDVHVLDGLTGCALDQIVERGHHDGATGGAFVDGHERRDWCG
jgi:hypothetical protein